VVQRLIPSSAISAATSRYRPTGYSRTVIDVVQEFLDYDCQPIFSSNGKAKCPEIYTGLRPLTGKPEQQRFTVRSGALTSISSRQRSAISGRPLRERAL